MSYASYHYERRSSSSVLVVSPAQEQTQKQQQQQHHHHRPHRRHSRARSVVEVHRRRNCNPYTTNHFEINGSAHYYSPTSFHSTVSTASSSLSDSKDTVIVVASRRQPDYNFYFEARKSIHSSPSYYNNNYSFNEKCQALENDSRIVARQRQSYPIRYKSPTFPFNERSPSILSIFPPKTLTNGNIHEIEQEKEQEATNEGARRDINSKQDLLARCDYVAESYHELSISKDEVLQLIDDSSDWWMVENEQREIGFVPSRFVVKTDGGVVAQNNHSKKVQQLSNQMGLLYSIKKRLRSISASSQPGSSSSSARNGCTALASAGGGMLAPGAPYHYSTGTGGQKCSDDFERPPVWSPPRRMSSNLNNSNPLSYQNRGVDHATTTTTSSSSAAGSSSLSPPTVLRNNNIGNNTAYLDDNKKVLSESIALFDYRAKRADELGLNKNDKISVLEKNDDGWWRGINRTPNSTSNCDREGWFPSNFVRELYYSKYSPTKQQQSQPNGDLTNDKSKTQQHQDSRGRKKSTTSASETDKIPTVTANGTAGEFAASSTARSSNAAADVSLPYSAMYPFKANNDDELSFERHEVLTVLDHPSCGHNWLRARSADGHIGLVPRNFIEPLSRVHTPEKMLVMAPSLANGQQKPAKAAAITGNGGKINPSKAASSADSSSDLIVEDSQSKAKTISKSINSSTDAAQQTKNGFAAAMTTTNGDMSLPHKDNHSMSRKSSGGTMPAFIDHDILKQRAWYYGSITRAQCDDLLNRFGTVGEFLVRDSETGNAGDFAISLRAVPRNKHFKVQCDAAKQVLCIGSRQFPSLDAIIQHYQQTPICTLQSGDKLHLKMPLKTPR